MSYRINTVSELTGIPRSTIVTWERRYGLPRPTRLPNGYRSYSDKDVARLVQIKRCLDEGRKISEVVATINEIATLAPPQGRSETLRQDGPFDAVRDALSAALLAYRRGEAQDILRRLVGVSFDQVVEQVFRPLLRDLGERWARGEVSVAQEHFASALIRDELVSMLLAVGGGPEVGRHVACATFPGERHEIPLLALALRLVLHGCRVTYLGTDLPPHSLSKFAREQRAGAICVSLTNATPSEQIGTYVRQLRSDLGDEVRLFIGGAGLPQNLQVDGAGLEIARDWSDLRLLLDLRNDA